MTLNEYVKNRDDMTFITVAGSDEHGWEICVRLDGTYSDADIAVGMAKELSKTLGIPLAGAK